MVKREALKVNVNISHRVPVVPVRRLLSDDGLERNDLGQGSTSRYLQCRDKRCGEYKPGRRTGDE